MEKWKQDRKLKRENDRQEGKNFLRICQLELEKLYQMPVIYILVIMCIAFNIFMLWDQEGYRIDAIRYDINEMKENPAVFAEGMYYDYYGKLDMGQVEACGKREVEAYGKGEKEFDDFSDARIKKNYEKLKLRAEEMTEQEKNSVTFTGVYELHKFLFEVYFKYLILESAAIIFVIIVYSMHFEEYHHTEELVLTSKAGTNIFRIKLLVSGLFALLLSVIVIGVSLLIYFSIIDYSSIWKSFVSSNYNTDKRTVNDWYLLVYPYITWVPMTIKQYLMAVLGIVFLILLFMVMFTGVLSRWMKNSILVLATTVITFSMMYFWGNEILLPNMLEFVLKCNPVHLFMKSGYWFMDYAPGDTYPAYEILTMIVWNGLAGVIFYCQSIFSA